MEQEQTLESITRNFLYKYVAGTLTRSDGQLHLAALQYDLTVGDREKAKGYVVKMFLRILAVGVPEAPEDAVMTVTAAACKPEFQEMLCDIVVDIIKEVMP